MTTTKVPVELSSTPGIVDNSNATAITIDSSENVGIGTSNATPSNGEGVCLGSGSTITRLDIRNSTTGDATGDGTSLQLNGNNFTIENREAGYVAFSTSLTERMRINSSGTVGIGTASPQTSTKGLHVVHDATEGTPSFPLGEVIIAQRNFNSAQGCHIGIIGGSAGNSGLTFGDKDDSDIGQLNYNHSDNSMRFTVNTSEAMLISSDGYVNAKGNVAGDNAPDTQGLHFGWNYSNGAGESLIVFNRGAGSTGGLTFVDNSSSGTHDEVMRLESGNLGIGTTSPSRLLHLKADDSCLLQLQVGNTTGNCQILFGDSGTTTAGKILYNHTGNVMSFETFSSEAMRILSSGNLLIGRTSVITFSSNSSDGIVLSPNRLDVSAASVARITQIRDSSGVLDRFYNGASVVGSISCTTTATAFNTSSDQRLKENIADADDAGSKVDAIKVRQFDWKTDGSHQDYGMVAQELQSVAPEAVAGDADSEEMMSVDYSKLVPMLVKEIQSLRTRVAQLET